MSVEFSITKKNTSHSDLAKPEKAPSSPKIKSTFDRAINAQMSSNISAKATRPRSPDDIEQEPTETLLNQAKKISRQEEISQDDFEGGLKLIESLKSRSISKYVIHPIEKDLRQGRAQTVLDKARKVTRNPANTSLQKMNKILHDLKNLELEDVAPEIAREIEIIMSELQPMVPNTDESDSDIENFQEKPLGSDSEELDYELKNLEGETFTINDEEDVVQHLLEEARKILYLGEPVSKDQILKTLEAIEEAKSLKLDPRFQYYLNLNKELLERKLQGL